MNAINLHVVGCPRSGTTLMAEMLVACYPHQGHSDHEETIFKVAPHEQGLRLSKKPNDVLWMAPLLERDPALHVIAMLRDMEVGGERCGGDCRTSSCIVAAL